MVVGWFVCVRSSDGSQGNADCTCSEETAVKKQITDQKREKDQMYSRSIAQTVHSTTNNSTSHTSACFVPVSICCRLADLSLLLSHGVCFHSNLACICTNIAPQSAAHCCSCMMEAQQQQQQPATNNKYTTQQWSCKCVLWLFLFHHSTGTLWCVCVFTATTPPPSSAQLTNKHPSNLLVLAAPLPPLYCRCRKLAGTLMSRSVSSRSQTSKLVWCSLYNRPSISSGAMVSQNRQQ